VIKDIRDFYLDAQNTRLRVVTYSAHSPLHSGYWTGNENKSCFRVKAFCSPGCSFVKNQLVAHLKSKLKVVHRNTQKPMPSARDVVEQFQQVYTDLDEVARLIEAALSVRPAGAGAESS
jgi:hypothetical protein